MQNAIFWFRNDLRLKDHHALTEAVKDNINVYPVYIFNPKQWKETDLGFKRTGAFRTKFLLESVANLKHNLQKSGSDLIIKMGDPSVILPQLCAQLQCTAIYASAGQATEELNEETKLAHLLPKDIRLHCIHQHTLFDLAQLPFSLTQLPKIFTEFRKKVEKYGVIKAELPTVEIRTAINPEQAGDLPSPTSLGYTELPNADSRAVLAFEGGEDAAWQRLQHYFWDTHQLQVYKETRNGLIGADYSSKFSPWLAHGCISPRSIYHAIKDYENNVISNASTYWLYFELMWRDYFQFISLKHGNRLFLLNGLQDSVTSWKQDRRKFENWRLGQTGIDFVDANMRELLLTGFMSNRGRQNVASFLTKDLKIDWRWGARWFESQLIDYDVCSNWGNWMYVAGVGNDPRENRYFNIAKQAEMYDSKGEYRNLWLG